MGIIIGIITTYYKKQIVSFIRMSNQTLKGFLHKIKRKNPSYSKIPTQVNNTQNINPIHNNWFIVSGSVIGKSHITHGTVCQDSHFTRVFESLNGWGITIVCDGAGSATNSHLGSKFMAEQAIPHYFSTAIKEKQWHLRNDLPSEEEWREEAWEQLKNSLGALMYHAENDLKVELATLACTAIVVIYSPLGLLVTHIGDGRAAYCDEQGKWGALIKPHKGEEANMTYFITSRPWLINKHYSLPDGNTIPESRIIKGKVTAFALLSDGMEKQSFQCSVFDKETEKWDDPNTPFDKFFNPLVNFINSQAKDLQSSFDVHDKWKKFLTEGNEKIKNEEDDKTMILAVLQTK